MERERVPTGTLVAVVGVTVLGAALVPGAVADRSEEVVEGDLRIDEIVIADGRVGGETVKLTADVRLAHRRGVSENVTVEFRAVGLDSGLVTASRTVDVGRVSGDREVSVGETLTVERGDGYRVEAVVFRDSERTAAGTKEVRGTGGLTPACADVPVERPVAFPRFVVGVAVHVSSSRERPWKTDESEPGNRSHTGAFSEDICILPQIHVDT